MFFLRKVRLRLRSPSQPSASSSSSSWMISLSVVREGRRVGGDEDGEPKPSRSSMMSSGSWSSDGGVLGGACCDFGGDGVRRDERKLPHFSSSLTRNFVLFCSTSSSKGVSMPALYSRPSKGSSSSSTGDRKCEKGSSSISSVAGGDGLLLLLFDMLVVRVWILGHVVRRDCFCAAAEVDINVSCRQQPGGVDVC